MTASSWVDRRLREAWDTSEIGLRTAIDGDADGSSESDRWDLALGLLVALCDVVTGLAEEAEDLRAAVAALHPQ